MVLVAFTLPEVRVPEIKPLPWTEKSEEGEVVPRPRRPKLSTMTMVEVANPEEVGLSIAKRGSLDAVEVAETESRAKGEEVPVGLTESEFPWKSAVEVAVRVPKTGEVVADRVKV